MDALRQSRSSGCPATQRLDPRSRAVNGHPRPDLDTLLGLPIDELGTGDPAPVRDEPRGLDPVDGDRSGRHRSRDDLERQSSVVGLTIAEGEAAAQAVGRHERVALGERRRRERRVGRNRLVGSGQPIVEPEAGAKLQPPDPEPLVDGKPEGQRPHAMRAESRQSATLRECRPYQAEIPLGEVAQASVDQFGRGGRRPGAPVVLFHERHPQAAQRGIVGDPGAVDSAPDDQHVERSLP